jgi:FAD/FMN-containing dehydrogenase
MQAISLRQAAQVHDLGTILAGRSIREGDRDYDAARSPAAVTAGKRPALIIRAADAIDVALTIELARSTGLELAVRSGGHSMAGHSMTNGGILLDLVDMREMGVSPTDHLAWADAGITAGEFTRQAAAHGVAVGFGDTASVGVAGLTLGGGIGWLVRKHGLTIDNLLAVDMVTADGRLLQVRRDSHPNLFWALRGGGGNFGVATRFTFRAHPITDVVGGLIVLPAEAEVLHRFIEAAGAAPDELTTIAHLAPAPPMPFVPAAHHGRLSLLVTFVHAGDPERAGRDLNALRVVEPLGESVRRMTYPEIYDLAADGPGGPTAMRSTFVDEITQDTAGGMLERMRRLGSPRAVVQIRVLGGAMARVADDATAFAHRRRRILLTVAAPFAEPGERAPYQESIDEFVANLPGSGRGVYVNFLGEEGAERVREAYPRGTYERLAAIKRRYDPTNLFRRNANITTPLEVTR